MPSQTLLPAASERGRRAGPAPPESVVPVLAGSLRISMTAHIYNESLYHLGVAVSAPGEGKQHQGDTMGGSCNCECSEGAMCGQAAHSHNTNELMLSGGSSGGAELMSRGVVDGSLLARTAGGGE